jgi:hypothetical protein
MTHPTELQLPTKDESLLFDLEADALLPDVKKIWCGVILPLSLTQLSLTQHQELAPKTSGNHGSTVSLESFGNEPNQLQSMNQRLQQAKTLVGHNILGYDLPAVWKCSGEWKSKPLILDTLVLSRFLHPERYGGHSLAAWGERLNFPKTDFTDFTTYTPEMLEYCKNDVLLNYRVLIELLKEFKEKYNGATITEGFSVYT